MLRTRVIEEMPELERLAPAWRRLLNRAANPQPVLTPLWLLAWWREFGEADGRSLRVVAVEDAGELVGLLPLSYRAVMHRRAIPVRRLELLATGEEEADEIASDYVGGLAVSGREGEVARAMARAVLDGRLGRWDELRMTAMSGEDPVVPQLVTALREGGADVDAVVPTVECPYVPLPRTWDEYVRTLGSSRRYVVTRSLRELDAWSDGAWEFRRARSPEQLQEGTRILRELHSERWSAQNRSGVFASSRFVRFHDAVMPRLLAGEDGASLELAWLVARGRPLAASYSIVYGGKLYFYQSGRRVDVPKSVRPGIALHALSIRQSIEAGLREYDFLAGASRYKRDLALATRPLVALRAVGDSARARGIEAIRRLTEGAIARVRAVSRDLRRPAIGPPSAPAERPATERPTSERVSE
jgi:CelD/BcsL family acetyltransferase involved in cellulose biosynthesis